MTTAEKSRTIPPDVMAELEEAARRPLSDVRDPEVMPRACERMDRVREEVRNKPGILDNAKKRALLHGQAKAVELLDLGRMSP